MSAISTYLQQIINAIWARDVRQAIHDAISQCYDDVNAPALQTEAMQAAVQAKIDAGQMAALTIADGSLTGAKLANGTISTAKIADGAITTAKIADSAVTAAKVADGTLTGDKLANKTIGTTKIDDGAVTNAKLADSSVSESKIASGAVTAAKIADGAITGAKLAEGVIPTIDATLTQSGMPADAKVTGDAIDTVKASLDNLETLSPDFKDILLRCFEKVLWEDDSGAYLYSELSTVLTGTVVYKLGVNMAMRPGSYNFENDKTLYLSLTENFVSKRRVFYVDNNGAAPLYDNDGNLTNVYPVSVPENVTWAKVEIKPSERQLAIYPVVYDSQTQKYTEYVVTDGWHSGEAYMSLPRNGKDIYLPVFSRYDAAHSVYATDPSEVKITFGTQYVLGENMISVIGAGSPINGKIQLNTSTKRRTFYTVSGRETSYDANGNPIANRYPIPLPLNVKTVTAKIEPASMYIAFYVISYDESTGEYSEYMPTAGYKKGQTKYEITGEHGELYVIPVAKYDQAGSDFVNEPTELVIDVTCYA